MTESRTKRFISVLTPDLSGKTHEEKRSWWRIFFGCIALIVMLSSLVTNVVLLSLSTQNHTILTTAQSSAMALSAQGTRLTTEGNALARAGQAQLTFAGYLAEVDNVDCIKLHQINPSAPQCPAFPNLHIPGSPGS